MTQAMLKEKRELMQEDPKENKGFNKAFKAMVSRQSTKNFLLNYIKQNRIPPKKAFSRPTSPTENKAKTSRKQWLTNWKKSGVK